MTTTLELVRAALEQSARQHKSTEWNTEKYHDLVYAYDKLIDDARSTLAALDAVPEGLETTAEERRLWYSEGIGAILRLLRDLDHLLLEREAVRGPKEHPALKGYLQQHRDEAYKGGWDDGYAEGFGKAQALIAAAEEQIHHFKTEYQDTASCSERITAAVAAENEACAEIAENTTFSPAKYLNYALAEVIRARRKAPPSVGESVGGHVAASPTIGAPRLPTAKEIEAILADYETAQGEIMGNVRWGKKAAALLRRFLPSAP